jgi:hypothetical protein
MLLEPQLKKFKWLYHVLTKTFETIPLLVDSNLVTQSLFKKSCDFIFGATRFFPGFLGGGGDLSGGLPFHAYFTNVSTAGKNIFTKLK